jgi:mono/diheme cytochrome c family protein
MPGRMSSLARLGAWAVLALAGLQAPARAQDASLVARGEYLARAADCAACHTAPGGAAFAGGLPLSTPLGTIFSTNITPSATHGIGGYTPEQFARAVRDGVRADGGNLYPAMPYTAYAGITDADIAALYAYFKQGVPPAEQAVPATALPFPFNLRASMMAWNLLFHDDTRFKANAARSAEWNRGAYLANALEHCGTCHTPRNALMAEDNSRFLGGASLGTWYAPNITSDAEAGIGRWSEAEIVAYLRGGAAHGAQAAGPMLEAIDKSLSQLTEADLKALAVYLRSVPPVSAPAAAPPASPVAPKNDLAVRAAGNTAPAQMDGAQLYDAYCASCHQVSGGGTAGGGLPALAGNAAFARPPADNAVMAVLDGIFSEREGQQAMPAFRALLSDDQVARLTNTAFQQFGRGDVQVSPQRVAELRSGGKPSPLIGIARYGMVAAGVFAVIVLGLLGRWMRRRARPHAVA